MKHFLTLSDLSKKKILTIFDLAEKIKKAPEKYASKLKNNSLLMLYEKPSVRTRISFEVGMTQLGGHAIYYELGQSTLGKKETIEDFTHTVSRYVDAIIARLYSHALLERISKLADVPVINGLTDDYHPCQVLSDLYTIREKKGLKVKIAYLGDGNNNVTHSLILGCSMLDIPLTVAAPRGMTPNKDILTRAKKNSKRVNITDNASDAVRDADVVYTDSWMSYHIPNSEKVERTKLLSSFQVNSKIMKKAKKDAIFMHCLPVERGMEATDNVVDSKQSVVFDQAENRLHIQKALLLELL